MKPGASQSKAGHLESPPASADFKTRLIECSPDCLKVLDLDGRLLSMNAGGMAVLEIWHPDKTRYIKAPTKIAGMLKENVDSIVPKDGGNSGISAYQHRLPYLKP